VWLLSDTVNFAFNLDLIRSGKKYLLNSSKMNTILHHTFSLKASKYKLLCFKFNFNQINSFIKQWSANPTYAHSATTHDWHYYLLFNPELEM